MRTLSALAAAGLFLSLGAQAQETFTPEKVIVEPGVGPGPHLYVGGQNRLHVIDPVKLKYQGQISTGGATKLAFSQDSKRVYIAST